jgi:hypothetical protein
MVVRLLISGLPAMKEYWQKVTISLLHVSATIAFRHEASGFF